MKQSGILVILILISLVFVLPFFRPGYFETDDGGWAIVRQASMHRELKAAQLPVRWSSDLNRGYGYPLFHYSYPGPYYMGEVLHLLGLNFTDTIKALFILATVISILAMYALCKEIWRNELVAFLGAILYLSGTYRLLNLYVRGSLGETLALALFPLLCLFGLKLMATGKRRYLLLGSLMLSILIITHNVMSLIFLPFFIYFLTGEFFLRYVKINRLLNLYIEKIHNLKAKIGQNYEVKLFTRNVHLVVVMLLVGIGLSAFFWLPALREIKYVRIGSTPLANIDEQFRSARGIFLSPLDTKRELEQTHESILERRIELARIVVLLAGAIIIYYYRRSNELIAHRAVVYYVPYIGCLLLLLPISAFLWKTVPGLKLVDFPWRVYALMLFIFPLLIAPLALIPKLKYIAVGIATIFLISSLQMAHPQKYTNYPDSFYATNQGTTTSADEYLSRWVTSDLASVKPRTLLPTNTGEQFVFKEISSHSLARKYTYTLKSQKPIKIYTGIMYFPGWQTYIDEKESEFTYKEDNGVLTAVVPPGEHTLKIIFKNTETRTVANTISLSTVIFLAVLFSVQYSKGKKFIFL
jgi:hypothetical protein